MRTPIAAARAALAPLGKVAVALLAGCASAGTDPARAPASRPAASSSAPPTGSAPVAPSTSTSTSTSTTTPTAAPVAVARRPWNYCAHNTAAQLVRVSLDLQRMWLCAHSRTVRTSAITSGMSGPYTETPTGRFHIQGLNRDTVLTLNTGATYDVKYWIPFDAPLFGFHDSSWQHFPYGSPKYRTAGSHGCIHVPLREIAFLYRWVDIGADVSIA